MNDTSNDPKQQPALDFKSASLYAVRVVLHSHETQALIAALDQRMHDAGSFFENEAVVVDATQVDQDVDWETLLAALRKHNLHPVGVVAGEHNQQSAAAAGLAAVELSRPVARTQAAPAPDKDVPVVSANAARPETKQQEAAQAAPRNASATTAAPEIAPAAMVINRPLRSGQRIYARDTDLIVIGVVSQGAEVIADGNIHVYGPLRGKAMAGARGDAGARIFTTQLDPELLAIAGVYRVVETQLDAHQRNQPCIVSLDGDSLQITVLNK
ncbi:MAG: septum site-determining protein MinC [Candidimonas sp.]